MRVRFNEGPVHKGTRIAFVGVTDQVFLLAGCIPAHGPFLEGGKSRTTTASEACLPHHPDYVVRRHLKGFHQALVAINSKILINVLRIDEPAVSEDYSHLRFQHGELVEPRYIVIRIGAEMAYCSLGKGNTLLKVSFQNVLEGLRSHVIIAHSRLSRHFHINKGFEITRSYTAHFDYLGLHPVLFDESVDIGQKIQRSSRPPARCSAHIDDRFLVVYKFLPFLLCQIYFLF
ncbi:MAG: hypothetical protein A4E63_00909 [Syntrophorhabdus sp. PtaU1.Bin050]|nr:MAG: hypothetical protein A4E63_00909 [Syntrophorhabdus sp. PtaU1.Bin050]